MKTRVLYSSVHRFAFVVLIGSSLSCASTFWLDDARTLGRGNWKVERQFMRQMVFQNDFEDESKKYFRYLPKGVFQVSYGLTNRMDVGVISNQFILTGATWKYRLTRSNTGHILSIGGRMALRSYLEYDEVGFYDGMQMGNAVDGHIWYTLAFTRTAYTIQPTIGVYYFDILNNDKFTISMRRKRYQLLHTGLGLSLTSALDENVDFRVGLLHGSLFDLEDKTKRFYLFNITWGVSYYIR